MKMSYRGNSYQPSATSLMEVREGDIIGKYRGCEVRTFLPRHIPQLQPKIYLQYRGIAYSSNPNAQPYFVAHNSSTENKSESLAIVTSHETQENLAQVHLANLRRNLERRMAVAQSQENYSLLGMLKKECEALKTA
ncbi:MAG: DUF4278 domain-containing protein [Cyanobacterium sp. T60_A2020_053]|nr:DUF4278 domain-containing protein [Cyanobacterium sp. T60_A2020_053]